MINSTRDELKDRIKEFLVNNLDHDGNLFVIGNDELNELVPDIVDVVCDILDISPEQQDLPYE